MRIILNTKCGCTREIEVPPNSLGRDIRIPIMPDMKAFVGRPEDAPIQLLNHKTRVFEFYRTIKFGIDGVYEYIERETV